MTIPEAIFEPGRKEVERSAGDAASLGMLFAQVCERHGERTAVSIGSESLTYAELNELAGRVAAALASLPVSRGSLVAIYLERSIALVGAMIGTIQAGAAYLPLDCSYPAARVLETVADAAPAAILTTRSLAEALLPSAIPFLFLEELPAAPVSLAAASETQPDDPAYVIYTSGSTGRPKGVLVSHRNVVRLLSRTQPWFEFNEHDVWTLFHSFAFDFSVWEMWGCLLYGGRLVIVPFAVSRSPEEFHALLGQEGVTILNQTPSAFSLLIQADGRLGLGTPPLALRCVILGGEALNLRALRPWFERHGDAQPEIVNMYGITETTVHVTYRRVRATDAERETDSLIGEPIPDLQIHLLDEHLLPVAEGETGEICVGGGGVAMGYLNRPELTAERFVADPFGGPGARLYRSGDLARRRSDGELVYLGRADRQVKIHGFRIELGEIEAVLSSHPELARVCVSATPAAEGTQRLAAYYVCRQHDPGSRSLGDFLSSRLPAHMRPAFYVRLEAFPLTGNGKIDRAALPAPSTSSAAAQSGPAASVSPMEAAVARAWRRVLQVEHVAVDENFFDAGGTSLLLIAVRAALQDELLRTLPVTWFFECTTIRALAARLDAEPAAAAPALLSAQEKARRQREVFARNRITRMDRSAAG